MDAQTISEILADPVAERLMASNIPARLAYTALDGSPRVVPVGFHFRDGVFVVGTSTVAGKVKAIAANPKVALTIDTESAQPDVLLVRGTATTELVDGVPEDYLAACRKRVPAEEWETFEGQVRMLYDEMVLITITPEWVKVMDFETRIPKSVEDIVRRKFALT